jgi:hypothetical protein
VAYLLRTAIQALHAVIWATCYSAVPYMYLAACRAC